MKKLFYGLMLAGMLIMVIASPVLAAVYYASVQVQESDGNSYTRLPISASIDNEYLADNNYILATGLDTRVITGSSVELPWMVADDRLLFVSNINANNTYNFQYTTGNTPPVPADMPVIVGYDGYVTIPSGIGDDMQLGDDFEIEFSGYVDTSAGEDKNIVYKENTFMVYVQAEDVIRASILNDTPTDETLRPDGVGGEANLSCAGTNWEAVSDESDTTFVYISSSVYIRDLYTLADSGINDGTINSVTVYVRYKLYTGEATVYALPCFKIGDTVYDCTEQSHTSTSYQTKSEVITESPATSSDWTWDEINNMKFGVSLKASAGAPNYCSELWLVVNYAGDEAKTVTVTGISSGVRKVVTTATGAGTDLLTLSVYDADDAHLGNSPQSVALGAATVPDNANDWVLMQNNVMPYVDYYKHSIPDAGTLIAWYQPVAMIHGRAYTTGTAAFTNGSAAVVGTTTVWTSAMVGSAIKNDTDNIYHTVLSVTDGTHLTLTANYSGAGGAAAAYTMAPKLPDRQGTEEMGAITWGVNPSGVDVDIGSLTAYSQPAPSGTIDEPGQDIVEETGQTDWTSDTGTLTTNPFYPAVLMASEQTGFDVTQIWLMIATFFIIGGMLAVFGWVPHQLITVCVGGGITGFFISQGIYPPWTIFIFLVMGVAVVLWERAPAV